MLIKPNLTSPAWPLLKRPTLFLMLFATKRVLCSVKKSVWFHQMLLIISQFFNNCKIYWEEAKIFSFRMPLVVITKHWTSHQVLVKIKWHCCLCPIVRDEKFVFTGTHWHLNNCQNFTPLSFWHKGGNQLVCLKLLCCDSKSEIRDTSNKIN